MLLRFLALALLTAVLATAQAQSIATYRVTFESTWSAQTHPDGFPPNPHFSGLIGATHNVLPVIWEEGELASPGIESMAETGSKTLLQAEVNSLIALGEADAVLSGGPIGLSPGSVSMTFDVSEDFPFVTLVSMLAPSPDWFVGTSGLDMRPNAAWETEIVYPLYVYDAGTDSGPTYTSPNQDTNPPEAIAQITAPPFLVGGTVPPVGTFTFTLLSATASEETPASSFGLDTPIPNPLVGQGRVDLRLDRPQAVQVAVFDALGRRVAVLHEGTLSAGTHRFRLDARTLRSGLYIIRARGVEARATRRLVVR